MADWLLFSNMDGSFSLYEDPLGDAKDGASLGIVAVVCLIVLTFPVFSNPEAFVPSLVCFLLALVFRLFFCKGSILSIFCPLLLPFAGYSFVQYSETLIVNEEGGLVIVALPVIVIAAILYGLLIVGLMGDPDSEFGMAMVVLFGLVLGIAAPLAGLGIGMKVVVFYALRLLYVLTAALIIRNIVLLIEAANKGQIRKVSMAENFLMFAVGCAVYLLICVFGTIFGDLSGILCVLLFVALTVFYLKVSKRLLKSSSADVDTGPLRFILLPTVLICLLDCFGSSEFTVEDDLICPLAGLVGRLQLLPRLAGLCSNTVRSFAVLFAELAELFLRIIEKVFDCSIESPHLSDLAGMLLGIITMSAAMLLTRRAMERAQRRREWKERQKAKNPAGN